MSKRDTCLNGALNPLSNQSVRDYLAENFASIIWRTAPSCGHVVNLNSDSQTVIDIME